MLAPEQPGQRLLTRFDHDAFPHPLPKLRLCSPELFSIPANYQCCLFFAFLLFVCIDECCVHVDTPLPLRVENEKRYTQLPLGEASLARQQQIVKLADELPLP